MTCKIIFTVPFYRACGAQPPRLLGCYTVGLQSWRGRLSATYIFLHDLPLFLYLLPYG
jgi:hypothetical protein